MPPKRVFVRHRVAVRERMEGRGEYQAPMVPALAVGKSIDGEVHSKVRTMGCLALA